MPINYANYPPNWLTEIRPRILKRANNKCEFCGVPNYKEVLRGIWFHKSCYQDKEGVIYDAKTSEVLDKNYVGFIDITGKKDFIKVVLTIAHLDHDVENWQVKDERLAALCQRCHLNYDRQDNHRKKRIKRYSHSLFPLR